MPASCAAKSVDFVRGRARAARARRCARRRRDVEDAIGTCAARWCHVDDQSCRRVAGTWYPGTRRRAHARRRRATSPRVDDAVPARPARRDHRAACRPDVLGPGRRVRLQGGRAPAPFDAAVLVGPVALRRLRRRRAVSGRRVRLAARARADRRGAAARSCSPRRRSSSRCRRRTRREHSLEMQLPFLAPPAARTCRSCRCSWAFRRATTIDGARRRARAALARPAASLLVASTDLSHYFDARDRARRSTGACRTASRRFDPDGLLRAVRGISGRRARTLRRVRRRAGDRGDAGGARARRARRRAC